MMMLCKCLKYSCHYCSSASSNSMGWSEVFQFDDMALLCGAKVSASLDISKYFSTTEINNPIILF